MLRKIILCTAFTIQFSFGFGQGEAFEYFSDYDLVKKITNAMPDGQLNNFSIVSAAVVNNLNGYYIIAKLSNAETVRIYSDTLHQLINNDKLVLAGNVSLVLENDGEIAFFNKSDFHKTAFAAKTFVYKPELGDALDGVNIPYQILDVSLLNDADDYGSDSEGRKYRYRVKLKNGKTIYLSLPQAFAAYRENRFISNITEQSATFGNPASVSFVYAYTPALVGSGSTIRYEIKFESNVFYPENTIVFEVKKSNNVVDNNYYYFFDVYIPNATSTLSASTRTLKAAGFFAKTELLKDQQDQSRLILRSYLLQDDFDFVSSPPKVTQQDAKTILVTYAQSSNQTTPNFDYSTENSEPNNLFEISNKLSSSQFYRNLAVALREINLNNNKVNSIERLKGLISGLSQLDQVAALSENDAQLLEIITAKDTTRERIYTVLVDYFDQGLKSSNFNLVEANSVLELVQDMFVSPQQQEKIVYYRNQISNK